MPPSEEGTLSLSHGVLDQAGLRLRMKCGSSCRGGLKNGDGDGRLLRRFGDTPWSTHRNPDLERKAIHSNVVVDFNVDGVNS